MPSSFVRFFYACNPSDGLLHHTARMTPSTIIAPSPIKLVEPFIDFAAVLVVVVDDDEGAVEVEVKVEVDNEVEEEVAVIGTEK